MAAPALSKIKEQTGIESTFQISAGGADYFISILFINELGQTKAINRFEFKKLVFESTYKTPFLIGQLQLLDTDQQNKFIPTPMSLPLQYEMIGSGGEFIWIKVEMQSASTRCKRIELINKVFVSKTLEPGLAENKKVLNYYFADIEFGALMYTKYPFSTNDYISQYANRSNTVSQLGSKEKTILVSDAIAALLLKFANRPTPNKGRYSGGTGTIEVDKNGNRPHWDKSSSRIEYTLQQGRAPMVALFDLMSKYVSEQHDDMGILMYYNGSFRLKSLTNIFKGAGGLSNNKSLFFKENFAGGIKIQTDDIRMQYSNRQSNLLVDFGQGTGEENSIIIPVHISNVTFDTKAPDSATNVIVDHSVSSYDLGQKAFKLFNKSGSIDNLKSSFSQYAKDFPDSETKKELNVNKSDLTKPNKHRIANLETFGDHGDAYGKIILQQKMLDSSDKMTIDIPGNLKMTGSKFIGVQLGGLLQNNFMKNIPGFWYVLENITTLQEGGFNSTVVCSKFDKEKTPPTPGADSLTEDARPQPGGAMR